MASALQAFKKTGQGVADRCVILSARPSQTFASGGRPVSAAGGAPSETHER